MSAEQLDAEPQSGRRRTIRRYLLVALAALVAAGAAAGGYFVGDDSDQVRSLTARLTTTRTELQGSNDQVAQLQSDNSDLNSQISSLHGRVSSLSGRLRAEKGLNQTSAPGGGNFASSSKLGIGDAAAVEDLLLKPTSLQKTSSGTTDKWVVRITAENTGSKPVDIFCGDTGASLTDALGRTYESTSVLEDDTANCGDDLAPGIVEDSYEMSFKVPHGAKPASLKLWGDFDYEDSAQEWAVG